MNVVLASAGRAMRSCGLLLLPILAWNALLSPRLSGAWAAEAFWRDIPASLAAAENGSRVVVIALPFLMPLELKSETQRRGLMLFCAGVVVYFASWVAILLAPASPWSTSAWGFMAPAYLPAIWLLGLTAIGQRLFWGSWYRWWMYGIAVAIFVAAHVSHAGLIYARMS